MKRVKSCETGLREESSEEKDLLDERYYRVMTISPSCGTATAQASPNIAFIIFTLAKLD